MREWKIVDLTVFFVISPQVSYKLHELADAKGPDAVRCERLAKSVEEFTHCLLDPLKTDPDTCKYFGDHCLDGMLDDAIGYDQKKVILSNDSIVFAGEELLHLVSYKGRLRPKGVRFSLW